MTDKLSIFLAMAGYMLIVILIGVFFAKKSQESSENYFLGGRSLGPWVAAMSAEASDMSGWLLMGLPGVAYWCGLADATWTAIGLAVGTYVNWLLVSKRLRNYSQISNNAITLPDYLSNRFHEKKKVILLVNVFFLSSKERRELLKSSHLMHMYIHSDRVTMYPFGEEKPKNGGTKMFVWLIWDKDYEGLPTFDWI